MRGVTRVLAACALVGVAAAHGATLRVPEDYPSLLAAVDATASGDSVVVGPGTWSQTATRVVIVNGQSLPVTACAFLKPGIVIAVLAIPGRLAPGAAVVGARAQPVANLDPVT